MDLVAQYHGVIDFILGQTGLSDKVLHFHAGMAIFVLAQFALRTRRASLYALAAVIVAEGGNEIMDRMFAGSWNWSDTLGDIFATLFWPTILVGMGYYRRARWNLYIKRQEGAAKAPARNAPPSPQRVVASSGKKPQRSPQDIAMAHRIIMKGHAPFRPVIVSAGGASDGADPLLSGGGMRAGEIL